MGNPIEYIVKVEEGSRCWYVNGKLHREDGPALEYSNGTKCWFKNGDYHREDGPACEYADGNKYWYLKGIQYTEQDFNKKMNKTCDGKVVEIDGKKYKLTSI